MYIHIHTSYSVIHLCFLFGYMHDSTSDGQEVPSWASCRRGFWWRCRNPGWMEVSYGGTPSYGRKVSQTSDRCSSGESSQRRVRRERGLRERVGRNKIAKHCVFPMFCGCGGSKSRFAKAAGAQPCGRDEWSKIARRCGAKQFSKSKS